MTDSERIALIREVYETLHDGTESFEPLCPTLPYLFAAIAGAAGGGIDLHVGGFSDDEDFLGTLRLLFPETHAVWKFVTVRS